MAKKIIKEWKSNKNYRQLSIKLVYRVIYDEAFSNLSFDEEVKKSTLASSEVSRTAALYYGVLSKYKLLEKILSLFVDRSLSKLDSLVKIILIVASYELLYMHFPAYATINEFVDLCRYNKYSSAASFVNAILRKVDKNREGIFSKIDTFKNDIRYSIDERLLADSVNYLGKENCFEFLERAFFHKRMSFRFRGNAREKELFISEHGSAFSPSKIAESGIVLNDNFSSIDKANLYRLFMPQGELAMLAPLVLDPKEDEIIADFCAAPGNKSLQIQDLRGRRGELFCYDLHENRVALIEKRFKLASYPEDRLQNLHIEARDMTLSLDKKFDKILLDAPCSSYGMLASKPELRYKYDIRNLAELRSCQELLLENASSCLKVGGTLVYSTCTLRYDENEGQVERFLAKHSNFVLSSFVDPRIDRQSSCDGLLKIVPSADCNEGFFISKLTKLSE